MGNYGNGDAHAFVLWHRGVTVKTLDVSGHRCCAWGGEKAIKEDLGCGNLGGWGADWARVADQVASSCEAYMVRLFFLHKYIGNETGIGCLTDF